jgi:hypothetical protein
MSEVWIFGTNTDRRAKNEEMRESIRIVGSTGGGVRAWIIAIGRRGIDGGAVGIIMSWSDCDDTLMGRHVTFIVGQVTGQIRRRIK